MRIALSNKFYRKEAILEAIDAFKDICSCKILNESFELDIAPKEGNSLEIQMEFCNFVLALMKENL